MCGRNSLFTPLPELEERFDAEATFDYAPRYNVAPREDLAVVRNADTDAIDALEWGLLPSWVDEPSDAPRPINARAETAAEKPTFREACRERRCLVLSSGFYEWQERAGAAKQPYRIYLEGDTPFAFAGLWDRWEGDGTTIETVTILTTEASDAIRPIHDRMPVMLTPDEEDRWLAADDDATRAALCDSYAGADLRTDPISTAVNDPENDAETLLEPVEVDEQSGLGDF
jgi:putative SOS response-associated peptidase YedK